jgi:hypothetical protein
VWRRRRRDRLESALLAWAVVWVVLSASTVFSRVEQEFVRYTAEFLGRINLATIPLVAILAAKGAAAGWDDETPSGIRTPLRGVAVVLIAWALYLAWHALNRMVLQVSSKFKVRSSNSFLDEGSVAQFFVRALELGFGVHHDRSVPGHGLFERPARGQQEPDAVLSGLNGDLVAGIEQHERSVDSRLDLLDDV